MTDDARSVVRDLRWVADATDADPATEVASASLLRRAADFIERLTAPIEGLETTALKRDMFRGRWSSQASKRKFELSLLRDFVRLLARANAETARADECKDVSHAWSVRAIKAEARAERAEAALKTAQRCFKRSIIYQSHYDKAEAIIDAALSSAPPHHQ